MHVCLSSHIILLYSQTDETFDRKITCAKPFVWDEQKKKILKNK